MVQPPRIDSAAIETAAIDSLCELLQTNSEQAALDHDQSWPTANLAACGQAGVFRWFHDQAWGGVGWEEADVLRGYLKLSAACLTTTFVITQRTAACQRLERSSNEVAKRKWLPGLVKGETFATVAISHLTTSRQHVAPVMRVQQVAGGFILDGLSPWVTGAKHAELVVTGGTLEDGRQILVALPTDRDGVHVPDPMVLYALTGSATGTLTCERTFVSDDEVLFGPTFEVMKSGAGGGTGGLQTSTLALGATAASLQELRSESLRRPNLKPIVDSFEKQWHQAVDQLLQLANSPGRPDQIETLRQIANELVLRTTQAALATIKGTGFVAGHPAGRRAVEALFFLVWSCPQGVLQAHLCDWSSNDTIDRTQTVLKHL